jgi:hypothetical protein
MNAVDFLGRSITVGSLVAYPVRRGSKMWLNKLRVQQVVPDQSPWISGYSDGGRRVQVKNLENVVVVQEPGRQHIEPLNTSEDESSPLTVAS